MGPETSGQAHPNPATQSRAAAQRPMPPELADVALIDAPRIAAAACISVSSWHEYVRRGEAPAPVLRAPRCTRWRLVDVRQWLHERAERGSDPAAQAAVIRAAQAGAKAAQAKRQIAKGG